MAEIITTSRGHGMESGDVLTVRQGRWRALRTLFTRPRIQIVTVVTETTFTVESRRMTWREWRAGILALFRP
jgi:hypothetical protein